MAQRSLLCIEPDAATVAGIRDAFQPHEFRVENISNGDLAIEWAKTNHPALIILAVEPRKVGYAICNKLKRNPALHDTPLVLISSEETKATLDQHKKLKSRADAYLLKPVPMPELLAIVERLVGLEAPSQHPDSEEIELADDEIAEVSLDDDDALIEEESEFGEAVPIEGGEGATHADHMGVVEEASSLQMLGDLSKPMSLEPDVPSPFHERPPTHVAGSSQNPSGDPSEDQGHFERETEAAFAALEAGPGDEGGGQSALGAVGSVKSFSAPPEAPSETVDLQSLWDDDELPEKLPWEDPQSVMMADVPSAELFMPTGAFSPRDGSDSAMIFGESPPDPLAPPGTAHETATPSASASRVGANATTEATTTEARMTGRPEVASDFPHRHSGPGEADVADPADAADLEVAGEVEIDVSEDVELGGIGNDVPPLPEEVLYDDRSAADLAHKEQRIGELASRVETLEAERTHGEGRAAELQTRIESLEAERQTLRRELDEQRDRMTHAASQGAFSKERDLLSLREVINKKEKDILDLRDALDAKERQILDHKDKIRENERARRDLEERTLGFEKSLFLANEKASELIQDRDKSIERERGLKARLDDAHEELRKGQDEIEALRKRVTQEVERGRMEVDRTRIELEGKLIEARETHHAELSKATDEWTTTEQARQASYLAELARMESAHRVEIEGLQRRLADESVAAADRLQMELSKLRRDHDKTISSMKEEQALQLASERQAYEAQTDAKQRAYRDEIMGLRRRHEEELAVAEDRRQRDILEQEQRRVGELEQAEIRRRVELQGRDEEHHSRVTEIERRHLIEKTESAERHRLESDQAVGRAVRAEGELIARSQELEQAYRRLAGFEADLDAARMELGDRDLKLTQNRDRIGELEGKLSDYEDQIVRAYQRLRADEKTGEKIRRALAVALALMDERASGQPALKSTTVADEAEKS